ncbi:hypothetical protein DdX_07185 [Ditylenchus destructor]|uniref:SH2 domain-containing protein n=1 Tax=Ditylenchus destructor TaxID=166010 RepID=A0AAD4R8P7_9BILA|nr:hypothetical protein DdX_07185 [Ditylenchus destructor]
MRLLLTSAKNVFAYTMSAMSRSVNQTGYSSDYSDTPYEKSSGYENLESLSSGCDLGANSVICCAHGKPCDVTESKSSYSDYSDTPYEKSSGYENLESLSNGCDFGADSVPYGKPCDVTESKSSYSARTVNRNSKPKQVPVVQEHLIPRRAKFENEWYKTKYIGEQSLVTADKMCSQPVSFMLYHRYPSSIEGMNKCMPQELPLFIVYKTSRGDHCHYRILESANVKRRSSRHPRAPSNYKVDISGEPHFSSLKDLIRYYSTYVILNYEGGFTDLFPWWKTKNDYKHRADIYGENDDDEEEDS